MLRQLRHRNIVGGWARPSVPSVGTAAGRQLCLLSIRLHSQPQASALSCLPANQRAPATPAPAQCRRSYWRIAQ